MLVTELFQLFPQLRFNLEKLHLLSKCAGAKNLFCKGLWGQTDNKLFTQTLCLILMFTLQYMYLHKLYLISNRRQQMLFYFTFSFGRQHRNIYFVICVRVKFMTFWYRWFIWFEGVKIFPTKAAGSKLLRKLKEGQQTNLVLEKYFNQVSM